MNYRVKRIPYNRGHKSILLQSDNGPCALLAIANILLLRGALAIHPDVSAISTEDLVNLIANLLLDNESASTEQVSHAISLLPHLDEGLHVNVRFSGISDFTISPELAIFKLLNIPLYHVWLPSPEDPAYPYLVAGDFDSLQLLLVRLDQTPLSEESWRGEAQAVERWFELNASQMTADGLFALVEEFRDNRQSLAVLFRNNHFAVVTKHKGALFTLVTDEGLADNVVWESLDQLDGDALFLRSLSISNDLLEPHQHEAMRTVSPAAEQQVSCKCCSLM
jgi:hypothetical protein